MLRSVSAALGWARRARLISANPATKVPKPRTCSRSAEALISDVDHKKLLAGATRQFREVLQVLHATGCRPGEVERITAESFRPEAAAVVITEHKTDRTGRARVVFLTPEVVELLKEKVREHPTGPLLLSRKRVPWTARSITQTMRKLKRKVGVRAIA